MWRNTLTEKPKKLMPVLVSGVIIFVLSSIPYVNSVNIACCAWALVGGVIAAIILVKRSPFRVTNGNGAAVGALSGLFGSLLVLLIDIPLLLSSWTSLVTVFKVSAEQPQIKNNPQSYEFINNVIAFMERGPALAAITFWAFFALCAVGMATLGGLVGVAIFEKRRTPPPPPPGYPPQYYPQQGPPPGYPPPGYPPQGQPPYGGQTPPQGQPPYGGDPPQY